jgi:hypothetical protein
MPVPVFIEDLLSSAVRSNPYGPLFSFTQGFLHFLVSSHQPLRFAHKERPQPHISSLASGRAGLVFPADQTSNRAAAGFPPPISLTHRLIGLAAEGRPDQTNEAGRLHAPASLLGCSI